MENELWEKCQMLVDAGSGDLVIHLYEEELRTNLTDEQLQKLGDVHSFLEKMMEKDIKMKNVISALIDMSRKGVILGPKK
ncbi:hypothetical protein JCM30204_41960 [Dysgonomonas termitidis]